MRRNHSMPYLKRVRARGKVYGYFDTGKRDDRGRRIYTPLGLLAAPEFGARYAACLGHRTRRAAVSEAMTTRRLLDLYQRSEQYRTRAASTRRVYDIYLGKFVEKLPTAPAGEVERRDVMLLIDSMADRPAAANLMLGAIRALYAWGRKREHVANNPCAEIDIMEVGSHAAWPENLVEQALADEDEVIRLSVHLLYFTAQRIGDVCRMRWSDIGTGGISVTQQKTGKALMIPIHSRLRTALDLAPKRGLTILTDKTGRLMPDERLRRAIRVWASSRTDLKIVPHGLRKNAVSALLEYGCTVAETAAISGQSLPMVEYYARSRNQQKLAHAAILKWEKKA